MRFFVHLLRHPGDGLSLLEQELGSTPGPDATRSGLLWGFGAVNLSATSEAPSSAALGAWLGGRVKPTGELWKTWGPAPPAPAKQGKKSRTAPTGLPLLSSDGSEGTAEALDRLRRDTTGIDTLHLALPLETRQEAFPRLEGCDRLAVYWEISDVLTSGLTDHLERLAEYLEESGGPSLELRLYSRWPDPDPERLQAVCQSLGHPVPSTLPTAKEATWQVL